MGGRTHTPVLERARGPRAPAQGPARPVGRPGRGGSGHRSRAAGLAQLRRDRGLSHRARAAHLPISHSALARRERGRAVPTEPMSDLAHAVGLSLEAFLTAADRPRSVHRVSEQRGRLRGRAGMTQADVAAQLQIATGTLSRLEVFVVGDMMSLDQLPGVAQPSTLEGRSSRPSRPEKRCCPRPVEHQHA
ncbi:helix-turn-helix domain-containing protein [Klenkia sp. LSe6-5]|uniref:Helix-turn-helix domain-containing protein n=1 Tax=Klenkia sesuvii TaxID=3103137 RepID=A0ABU8DWH8_9ACTN